MKTAIKSKRALDQTSVVALLVAVALLLIALMLATASVGSAQAVEPGPVDCKRAVSDDEVAICASEELKILDEEMHRAYRAARMRWTSSLSNSIKLAQQDWLKKRARCGPDTKCLFDRYVEQITELDKQRPDTPLWILEGLRAKK